MPMHPTDKHVGSRIRALRGLRGMSQTALGEEIGVTFQQVQKYENGRNRIGASRLWQISRALDVPVSSFFDGLPRGKSAAASKSTAIGSAILGNTETVRLVKAYYEITDVTIRKALSRLIKAIARPKQ